jgi:hypothetical protein
MGWFRRLFRAVPNEELEGVQMDLTQGYWEVDGPKTFHELLRALQGWLPEGAILYFEGGHPDREIEDFMGEHSVPEPVHLAMGTIWPRPKVYHVPATETALTGLIEIAEHHAEPELASHFHVYREGVVLLEWHDAFYSSKSFMLLGGDIPEQQVKVFANKIGKDFRRITAPSIPADANKGCR